MYRTLAVNCAVVARINSQLCSSMVPAGVVRTKFKLPSHVDRSEYKQKKVKLNLEALSICVHRNRNVENVCFFVLFLESQSTGDAGGGTQVHTTTYTDGYTRLYTGANGAASERFE